ncbi:MAG: hypothetical protein ACKOSO_05810, partial [Actinomycetota bacterium]
PLRGGAAVRGGGPVIAYLVLGALAVAVVVLVAWPLARPAAERDRLDATTEGQRRRLALDEVGVVLIGDVVRGVVELELLEGLECEIALLAQRARVRGAEAIRALDEELGTGPQGAR